MDYVWRFGALFLTLFGSALACGDAFKATGTGGSGAGTTDQPCTSVNDCELPTDPCIDLSCQNNRCTYVQAKDNSALPDTAQIPGDCKSERCLQGVVVTRDADDPPPSQECIDHGCFEGMVTTDYHPVNAPCGQTAATTCDGMGQCVGCIIAEDCGPHAHACREFKCTAGACVDDPIINQESPQQLDGDCKVKNCTAEAMVEDDPDPTDVPEDTDLTNCEAPGCDPVGNEITVEVPDGMDCENTGQICCSGVCCALSQLCEGTPDPICT